LQSWRVPQWAATGWGSRHLLALNVGEVSHVEHLRGLLVDVDVIDLERKLLQDEVHEATVLLLLLVERDATDGAMLDAAHEVGGEADGGGWSKEAPKGSELGSKGVGPGKELSI
jgi:hypothetical protein